MLYAEFGGVSRAANFTADHNDRVLLPSIYAFDIASPIFFRANDECARMVTNVQSSLRNSEIEFFKENLNSWLFRQEKKEDFKDILDRFLLISSSCFVKKSLHSKQLDHKRIFKIE